MYTLEAYIVVHTLRAHCIDRYTLHVRANWSNLWAPTNKIILNNICKFWLKIVWKADQNGKKQVKSALNQGCIKGAGGTFAPLFLILVPSIFDYSYEKFHQENLVCSLPNFKNRNPGYNLKINNIYVLTFYYVCN